MKEIHIGPVMKKILLLIAGGLIIGLSGNPKTYSKVTEGIMHEWKKINKQTRLRAIEKLYKYGYTEYENKKEDSLTLSEKGRRVVLLYSHGNIEIKKPKIWDGLWRVIIFDIPENRKKERDKFRRCLNKLGFFRVQKSVFIFPYECNREISYIAELFNIKNCLNIITAKRISSSEKYRIYFNLAPNS